MNEEKFRTVILFKNYFANFFEIQEQKVKDKIIWTFRLIETQYKIPTEYFKHIKSTDGVYEIRVQFGNNIFRIFCFFDKEKLIVLANGFQKKMRRTPKSEIDMALKIKKEYENEKEQ